jgi:hypothetical protein
MTLAGEQEFAVVLPELPTVADKEAAQHKVSNELVKIEDGFRSATNELRVLAPEAVARWDAGADFPIRVEQKIDRVYRIPAGPIVGQPAGVREVNGPAPDGFSIRIRFGSGQYNEAAFRTLKPTFKKSAREVEQGVFNDHVRAELPDHEMYMVADIEYGANMDTNTVSKIYDVLKARIATALESSGTSDSGE